MRLSQTKKGRRDILGKANNSRSKSAESGNKILYKGRGRVDYKEFCISKLYSVRWNVSRSEAGAGAGIHATEDRESHAKEFGHYYKHRDATEELPSRDEITQTALEVKHSAVV